MERRNLMSLPELKLVYVAGRYRADSIHEIVSNINRAWELGCEVASLGAMPVIPHSNTALMDDIQSAAFWLNATLELMRRCDAVILVPGWHGSTGTKGEIAEAHRLKIPVFETTRQLSGWLKYGHYVHPSPPEWDRSPF